MWRSLGYVEVPTSGTPVKVTVNRADPDARVPTHAILFQQKAGNTGKIYVLQSADSVFSTGVGLLAVLAIPTTNMLPSASGTITYAPSGLNANDFWVDADVNGEEVLVSVIEA